MGLATSICTAVVLGTHKMGELKPVKVALTRHWGTLHPGLQHTRNGDLVLSNQFDSLVGLNSSGAPVPLGAKSWEILDGFKKYKFKIDRSRRFSDGSPLEAKDFKRSWEDSLRLSPYSSNSSLADVLVLIEGYGQFKERGHISGIKVLDEETLEVSFDRPFRLALDFLSGNRFAAFKVGKTPDVYIGTGLYIIRSIAENELEFTPNPYNAESNKSSKINLVYMKPDDANIALKHGQIDVIGYGTGEEAIGGSDSEDVGAIIGQDALHSVVHLNGLKGRTLHDPKLRLALQWYVYSHALKQSPEIEAAQNAGFFVKDPQVFLPLQAGRIDNMRALELVAKGEAYFPQLIERCKEHPLRVWVNETNKWLIDAFSKADIAMTDDSGVIELTKRLGTYYKSHEADILSGGISITDGDPDGIYHVLGEHGAITSPMIQRARIAELLEAGREITDVNRIHSYYARISTAVLEEVPFIHLGFSKSISLIRKSKVEFDMGAPLRNQGHLHVFRSKE